MLAAIRASPKTMKPLFVSSLGRKVKSDDLISVTQVDFAEGHARKAEEEIYGIWLDYLEEIEGMHNKLYLFD